MRSSNRPH